MPSRWLVLTSGGEQTLSIFNLKHEVALLNWLFSDFTFFECGPFGVCEAEIQDLSGLASFDAAHHFKVLLDTHVRSV